MDEEDDGMDEEEDDDDDPSFGESKKKKKAAKVKPVKEPRMSGPPKLKKRESDSSLFRAARVCGAHVGSASAAFPTRKERSESSDEDYGAKSHKKKFYARNSGSGRATPEAPIDDAAWRRGAAKKVVTYDEAQVDYGLESEEDDEAYYQVEGGLPGYGGEADEIDQVLSHSRDEDHSSVPRDVPQENLVWLPPVSSCVTD